MKITEFRKLIREEIKKVLSEAILDSDSKRKLSVVKFTQPELEKIFQPFINKLVRDYGNDKDAMINYHIKKLVGIPYSSVKTKTPRPPAGWNDMMADIRIDLDKLAYKKAGLVYDKD